MLVHDLNYLSHSLSTFVHLGFIQACPTARKHIKQKFGRLLDTRLQGPVSSMTDINAIAVILGTRQTKD